MKTQKILAAATLAGLSLGGFAFASTASAQDDVQPEDIVLVQEDETTTTEGGNATEAAPEDGRPGRRGHRGGCDLSEAAEAIGIDEADLKSALDSGDTIADVAEANGADVDSVIDAMVAAKAEHIAEKVEDGSVTQEEADEKMADAEARITDRVNSVKPPRDA